MPDHDPNGESWEDWKRAGYDSYETFIEAKAGQCPPPTVGDELRAALDQVRSRMDPDAVAYLDARINMDWPMPEVPDWSEEESSDPADQ